MSEVLKCDASAVEIEAEIGKARDAENDSSRKLEKAKQDYLADILADDVGDAVKAKEALATAEIERDRAQAFLAALEGKLAETRVAEAAAALEAKRGAVAAEADAVEKALRAEYPKLAKALVALLQRLTNAESAVHDINGELLRAGRGDMIRAVECRAFPAQPHVSPEAVSIRVRTALVEIAGVAPGWN